MSTTEQPATLKQFSEALGRLHDDLRPIAGGGTPSTTIEEAIRAHETWPEVDQVDIETLVTWVRDDRF